MFFNFGGGDDPFGGGGRMPQRRQADVDTTGLYKILGIDKNASDAEIKKAYRKEAMANHPDKNPGSAVHEEKFKEIQKAYDILGNAQKKELYDSGGMDAVEGGGGGGGGGGSDILSQMFGMGGGGRRDTGPAKGEDQQHPLKCTLEDLYNGRTRKMKLNKLERCSTCNGSGCKDGKQRSKCTGCNGQGIKIIRRQIGPGMVQQMQARCPDCGGEGIMVKEDDKCRPCRGTGAEKKEKILSVVTDKGMRHGDKVYFRGEGDYEAGKIPGDIIFVVQQQEHDRFVRKGDDLLTEKSITLAQALCGMEVVIKHLDVKEDETSRHLVIKTRAGQEVIKPGDVRVISEEGMPQHKNPFVKGNMYIRFKVDFPLPSQIRGGGVQDLLKILPQIPDPRTPSDAEEVVMTVGDLEQLGANARGGHGRGATEEDDEDEGRGGGGQRVQCANQ